MQGDGIKYRPALCSPITDIQNSKNATVWVIESEMIDNSADNSSSSRFQKPISYDKVNEINNKSHYMKGYSDKPT